MQTVAAMANGLAWFLLALGVLTDGATVFLLVTTARRKRMASGVPVVALLFYAQFCSIRSALSLSCFAPVLAALCLVHLGVQWGLPVLLARQRS
ncbi:hypothetical protein [Myxococcus xanthus]|uniref:Uncharacterized protein n=1 Tax=Myxococcus xanthus TaxID=34 RepID=A0A7Y4MV79_MYXXA|nr:hypothetical protein [Myxococcus xanthus]NOJ83399.1 hypothetical protein [Myxococcus xanthus]NOJ87210.1 hypothetical protein [Myxococcus xanthus]